MSFPRYPAYKAAGVQWLVEVPSHWIGPKKIGDVSSLKGRLGWQGLKADEYREEGPFVVSSAHFSNFKIRWEECPHVSWERYELDGNIQLSVEDILLMKDGAALGKLAYVDELPDAACLNSHLLLFRPLQDGHSQAFIPKFAFYYMQSSLFQEFMQTRGTGATFMGVSQGTIARHLIHWPQLEEQRTIASFLDREVAKIDTLVAEQEQFVRLLKEMRQAVISNAVTKGLDPSVPMKDSGVEWWGKVPAHWGISPLKFLARIGNGSTPNRENPNYWSEDGFPWLNSSVVNQSEVSEGSRFVTAVALEECHLPIVEPPAVLVGLTGQGKTRGMAAPLTFTATINQHVAYIRANQDHLDNGFLLRVLEGAYEYLRIESDSAGSTKGAITCGLLGAWQIPVPTIEEQGRILAFLEAELTKVDSLIVEVEQGIGLLQERRSALISAAVTGQIDVRGKQ